MDRFHTGFTSSRWVESPEVTGGDRHFLCVTSADVLFSRTSSSATESKCKIFEQKFPALFLFVLRRNFPFFVQVGVWQMYFLKEHTEVLSSRSSFGRDLLCACEPRGEGTGFFATVGCLR